MGMGWVVMSARELNRTHVPSSSRIPPCRKNRRLRRPSLRVRPKAIATQGSKKYRTGDPKPFAWELFVTATLDDRQMTRFMHPVSGFDTVLHIAHKEWHGIRQSVAYAPGHKLLIPAESALESDQDEFKVRKSIGDTIERLGITHVTFQGYSDNADMVLIYLRARFGPGLGCFAVNHVTTSQFDNYFEMVMLDRMFTRVRHGMLDGIASVKPDFGKVFPEIWDGLILNYAPHLPQFDLPPASGSTDLYAPLAADWRKNMFTNVLAAELASNVDRIKVTNIPYGLENLVSLKKLKYVGFLKDFDLFAEMADSTAVLLATLAECQPMTQLEAMAVGTPALTGPLRLVEFAQDPLTDLTTSTNLDSPALLAADIERLVGACTSDPDAMAGMIRDHLDRRHTLASDRYRDFLGL